FRSASMPCSSNTPSLISLSVLIAALTHSPFPSQAPTANSTTITPIKIKPVVLISTLPRHAAESSSHAAATTRLPSLAKSRAQSQLTQRSQSYLIRKSKAPGAVAVLVVVVYHQMSLPRVTLLHVAAQHTNPNANLHQRQPHGDPPLDQPSQ